MHFFWLPVNHFTFVKNPKKENELSLDKINLYSILLSV